MRIIDDNVPWPEGVIVDVEKIYTVPFSEINSSLNYKFREVISKILFYLIHEGINLTRYKIIAYKLQRKILAERKVIFAYGKIKDTNNYVIALGPQDCPHARYLAFNKKLAVSINESDSLSNKLELLLNYFEQNQNILRELFYYSPYSGKELDIILSQILKDKVEEPSKVMRRDLTLTKSERRGIGVSGGRTTKANGKKRNLFLAGAGSYALSYILPTVKKVNYHTVIDLNLTLANLAAEKYKFQFADTSTERALQRLRDCKNPILIIATYHSTHLPIVEQAIQSNPNTKIFVEKPPVTTEEHLKKLISYRENPAHFIEIGYNRRYSPLIIGAKKALDGKKSPITMTCIIKELNIPLSHWYYWPSQGTRVVGNLSHWLDLGVFFIQKRPVSINVISASSKFAADEVSLAVKFEDNSLLTLIASDRGNKIRGVQEYLDIRCEDLTIMIDDFLTMKVLDGGQKKVIRNIIRDKGHSQMYRSFISRVEHEQKPAYPNNDLAISTRLYLSIKDLLLSGEKSINLGELVEK